MKDSELIRERISDVQHEIWSSWMQYLFSRCSIDKSGNAVIPAALVARWQRQIATKYADLSEKEQDSDREQADKVLACLGDG